MDSKPRRAASAPIALLTRRGVAALVVCCQRPVCRGETVVELTSLPADIQNLAENDIDWGCSHCGRALVITERPEERHAQFRRLTWQELQKAVGEAAEAFVPAKPVAVADAGSLDAPMSNHSLPRPLAPLPPFPPMTTWRPIHRDDLRSAFHVAVALEIRSLAQLKGKGASRNREYLEKEVHMFADRLLAHLVQNNMVFARGPMQQTAQSLGRSYPPEGT